MKRVIYLVAFMVTTFSVSLSAQNGKTQTGACQAKCCQMGKDQQMVCNDSCKTKCMQAMMAQKADTCLMKDPAQCPQMKKQKTPPAGQKDAMMQRKKK